MAQPEETQLESSVPGRQEDLDKVVETSSGPVFDGLSSSSSLKLSGGLTRTCSECGKQFSSGKALGGHKRACLQRKNTNTGFKLKPSMKMEVGAELGMSNVVEGGEEHRCFVCGQCFANLKSLYGHMRKHPERQWRGIHPPQQQPFHHHHHLSASSAVSNDHENDADPDEDDDYYNGDYDDEEGGGLDLVEPLKGWSVKDRRGRKSSWKEVDPEDKEAVSNLFFLASASRKLESGEGQSSSKKTKICSSGYVLLKDKERRHEADHDHYDHHDHDHDQDISEMGQQQKKRKLADLEPPNTTQRFECQLCNKAFDKHQALGGHVASHNNKSKIKNLSVKESSPCVDEEREAAAGESDQEDSGDIGDDDDDHQSSRVNGEQCHQCNICSKIFPTGQALGGHKRCHWIGPVPETFSSSSQLTTSTGGEVSQSQTPPRRGGELLAGGLDIDLNDTPEEFYQFFGFPEPHQEAGAASNDSPVR